MLKVQTHLNFEPETLNYHFCASLLQLTSRSTQCVFPLTVNNAASYCVYFFDHS